MNPVVDVVGIGRSMPEDPRSSKGRLREVSSTSQSPVKTMQAEVFHYSQPCLPQRDTRTSSSRLKGEKLGPLLISRLMIKRRQKIDYEFDDKNWLIYRPSSVTSWTAGSNSLSALGYWRRCCARGWFVECRLSSLFSFEFAVYRCGGREVYDTCSWYDFERIFVGRIGK